MCYSIGCLFLYLLISCYLSFVFFDFACFFWVYFFISFVHSFSYFLSLKTLVLSVFISYFLPSVLSFVLAFFISIFQPFFLSFFLSRSLSLSLPGVGADLIRPRALSLPGALSLSLSLDSLKQFNLILLDAYSIFSGLSPRFAHDSVI